MLSAYIQSDLRNEYSQVFHHFVPLHAHSVCIFSNLHFNHSLDVFGILYCPHKLGLESQKLSIESALVKVTYSLYNVFEVYLEVVKPAI